MPTDTDGHGRESALKGLGEGKIGSMGGERPLKIKKHTAQRCHMQKKARGKHSKKQPDGWDTSLGIPAALGLHGKSLLQHLSNQLKCVKIPLKICGDGCGLGKTAPPFWKVHETLQGWDLGWISPAYLLN